jgi:hypothetical protein
MRTPDSHRIRTVRYGSPPPDPVGLQTIFMCERHLVDPEYHILSFPRKTVFRVGLDSPPRYHHFCGPLNGYGLDGYNSSLLRPFGGNHQNAWMSVWSINAVRYVRFI